MTTPRKLVLSRTDRAEADRRARDHEAIGREWLLDDPFLTSFFDSASIGLPILERYGVGVIRKFKRHIDDEKLREEVQNFIQEEAAHSRVHNAYNAWLRERGYEIDRHEWLADVTTRFLKRLLSSRTNVAIITSFEFLIGNLGQQLLTWRILERKDVDPRLERLWTWHALEELDHRSASFDLYVYLGGGYVRRIFGFLIALFIFVLLHTYSLFSILRQNHCLFSMRTLRWMCFLTFSRRGLYRHLLGGLWIFFSPSFHPSQITLDARLSNRVHRYDIEKDLVGYFKGT